MQSEDAYQMDIKQVRQSFNKAASKYDANALLQKTVVERLVESFEHIVVKPEIILDLGSGSGYGASQLKQQFKKSHIIQADLSLEMLKGSRKKASRFFSKDHFLCTNAKQIPLPDSSVDLIFSSLMLQWLNNPDAVLAEVRRLLKPNGVFVFSTFGPDTLKELRESWRQVDNDIHVNAFTDMHDIGDALVRNGMDAPVLSNENIALTYDKCMQLMRELKNIGAHNVNSGRRKTLTGKQRMEKVIQYYETFRIDGKLPASYEVIYGHAWKPVTEKHSNSKTQSVSLERLKQDLQKRKPN